MVSTEIKIDNKKFTYLNIQISSSGVLGFLIGEMLNLDHDNIDLAAKALAGNADVVPSIKVRESLDIVGANGIEPLRRERIATERSGVKGASVVAISAMHLVTSVRY